MYSKPIKVLVRKYKVDGAYYKYEMQEVFHTSKDTFSNHLLIIDRKS